jgi:hypothetical protein
MRGNLIRISHMGRVRGFGLKGPSIEGTFSVECNREKES